MNGLLKVGTAVMVFIAGTGNTAAQEHKPNAVLQWDFPDLAESLAAMFTGEERPARMTAQLPENYTPEGKFPLFVFLHSGHGGHGEPHPVTREIIGPRDFICVTLPLFKRAYDEKEGALVAMDDFDTIRRAYRIMLQRLFDEVPNITAERSALGGFSNGGHTVAVLLAGMDEYTLDHFRSFFFVEGASPLAANVLQKLVMKRNRILVLYGHQLQGVATHEALVLVCRSLGFAAQERQLDFTSMVMRGAGHEMPPRYAAMVGLWARSERLPDSESH